MTFPVSLSELNQQKKISQGCIEQWNPKYCGKMDLVIKANGEWWHDGKRIEKPRLIQLFAQVLSKEKDHFYLKTPVEKIEICVEDAPFFICDFDVVNTEIVFKTTVGDTVVLSERHPLFFKQDSPYITVRSQLDAKLSRACFYRLVEQGQFIDVAGETILQFQSGQFYMNIKV